MASAWILKMTTMTSNLIANRQRFIPTHPFLMHDLDRKLAQPPTARRMRREMSVSSRRTCPYLRQPAARLASPDER